MKIYYENVNMKYYYIRVMINLMIFLEKCDHDTLELLKITKAVYGYTWVVFLKGQIQARILSI